MKNSVQLICYPDSLGGDLEKLQLVLKSHFANVFGGLHILPFYPSAGDRGFSPLDYFQVEPTFGCWGDIKNLGEEYDILADIMVNHISSKSKYFLDYLEKGYESSYKDFFIDLEKVWQDGRAVREDIDKMFLRRPVPYSTYPSKAFGERTVWTTFGRNSPSEQVDLDIHSYDVKQLFADIFAHFQKHNINIIRLDAVGYVIKKLGTSCFFVEPEIWEFMAEMAKLAKGHNIILLPEVHSHYSIQNKLANNGFWIYDFILPYRILEALLIKNGTRLKGYLKDRPHNQFTMLDCHDGIPIKPDLDGLVTAKEAKDIVELCLSRGANLSKIMSDAHKDVDGFDVHQIRGTIYSLLGCDDDAYIAARALQFFTPGIPQVYYVGLLAGKNDYQRVEATGEGREINRQNYSLKEIEEAMGTNVVQRLLALIKFRNEYEVFDGKFTVMASNKETISLCWEKDDLKAELHVDLNENVTKIMYIKNKKEKRFIL